MPIRYRVAERGQAGVTGGGNKKYCAMPTKRELVDIWKISKEIEKISTFSQADTFGVLYAMMTVIIDHIKNGDSVRLGDLGIFTLALKSKMEDGPEKVDAESIQEVMLKFRPSVRMKEELKNCEFKKIKG